MNWRNKLVLSDRAQLTLKGHVLLDAKMESKQFLGTTLMGIGPTYALKCLRLGLRVGDLLEWDYFLARYKKLYDFLAETMGI